LTLGSTYYAGFYGDTPNYAMQYMAGAQSINFYILFNQNPSTWQGGLNYTAYFGGDEPAIQAYRDRDFMGGFITRNF
jgi:Protein of unknown function (DUF1302)